jgi:hypothetical protein
MNERRNDHTPKHDTKVVHVCWQPAWHELDQSLALGETSLIALEEISPPLQIDDQTFQWKFSTGLDPDGGFEKNVRIDAIHHPILGEVLKIDACGLDYIVYPANGEEIIIDAEEDPGVVHNRTVQIENWSMTVRVTIIESEIV